MEISGWGWNAQYRSLALAAIIWRDGIKPLRLARNRHIAQFQCGVHRDKINLASLPPEIMERIENHTAEAIYRYNYVQEPFCGTHCEDFWDELGSCPDWEMMYKRYLDNNSIQQPVNGEMELSFSQTFEAVEKMHELKVKHRVDCLDDDCPEDDYIWEGIAKLERRLCITAVHKEMLTMRTTATEVRRTYRGDSSTPSLMP
jgi:hypothetical protein